MTHPLPRGAIAAAAVLVILTAVVYTTGLDQSPPYLMHDELQFSLQARSIAESGRDLSGRRFPIYFTEPEFPAGRDPAIIYTTAAFLRVLPFSQANVKVPTALIGTLDVALVFVAGWWLTGQPWAGVIAALCLALTPIHFMRARMVLSPFYSIPFLLGWLIAVAVYLRSTSRRALIAATACIALSVYTYLACTVMAPIYFATTLAVAWRKEGRGALWPMMLTALVILAPIAVWSLTHPERYGQLIEAYRLYGHGTTGVVSAPVLAPGTPTGPRLWVSLVWQFLDPNFLFISGDSSLINSTRTAGVFPMAFAILLPAGVVALWRSRNTAERVILVGLLTAPAASLLSGAIEMNRIMFVIPFAAVTAATGAWWLLQRGGVARVASVGLIAGVLVQFASFHHDYLTTYPRQAAKWFGGNVRDAVRELSKGEGPVYFSAETPFTYRYWAFYAQPEQPGRRLQVFGDPPADAPPGARAACAVAGVACGKLAGDSRWRQVAAVRERSGEDAFLVFERR